MIRILVLKPEDSMLRADENLESQGVRGADVVDLG